MPRLPTHPSYILALLGIVLTGCRPNAQTAPPGSPASAGGNAPAIQVVALQPVREPVHESLSLVGSVAANEQIEIKAESDGFVEKIGFVEGHEVPQGHLLVTLDETRLQAALEEAEAALKLSQQTYDRAKELLSERLIAQQEYEQASARLAADMAAVVGRRRALEEARVYAPFKGVVGARLISPGQLVNRATTLTWLVDLDPVKVEFNVPERFLSQVQPGQSVKVEIAAWPGRTFTGRVFFVAPFVEEVTRTILVKAEIPNPERLLKPGMFARLDLTLQVRENALVIPEAGLYQIQDSDRATVMVVTPDQTVAIKPVVVGLRLRGRVEVLSGLDGTEQVIVEGLQKVAPGMKVKLAPPEAVAPYIQGSV